MLDAVPMRMVRVTVVYAFTIVAVVSATAIADTPNILLILADDVGYGDLGCYGNRQVSTPNIDRLAAEGRRFTDAHSAAAVCTPSRYALLTGEYPFRQNLWGPAGSTTPLLIDPSRLTIASLLQGQGYATACIGKWHLGFGSREQGQKSGPDWNGELVPGPLELGFDHYFGLPIVNSIPPYVWVEDRRVVALDPDDPIVLKGRQYAERFPEKGLGKIGGGRAAHEAYRDRQAGATLVTKSKEWIRAHRNRPFFLYLATTHIHHPFTPAERFVGSTPIGRYGDFLAELDWMVGEVLDELDTLGLRDNTLVIFTSDNGGMINRGGQDAWQAGHRMNGDLLGFKFDAWEGGHRIPLIARWPGRITAGSSSNQLVCLIDMLPTFAKLTGAPLPPGSGPDGVDLLPALADDPPKPVRQELVISPFSPEHLAIRSGRWMYIGGQGGGGFTQTKPGDHALGGPAALAFAGEANSDVLNGKLRPDAPPAQLYDLEADPRQASNVIRTHPEVAEQLKNRLKKIQRATPN
jgi:arylsulfatase A